MEGRDPPAATDTNEDPRLSYRSPPPPSRWPPPTQPPPSSRDGAETYIVQIPRNLIYRVPPPENSRIVESFRGPYSKKEGCGGKCCFWIFISLAVLAAIVGALIAILHVSFSPKTPEFSVTNVLVKSPPASHNTHLHPTYDISLKADNPNDRMGVSYEDGGDTSLSFKNQKIAGGKYPTLSQEAKDSTTIHLTLGGSNAALPSEVDKSMKNSTLKTPISFSLTINAPIKLKGLIELSKDMIVTCDFKVSNLASGAHVLSQKCDTKF